MEKSGCFFDEISTGVGDKLVQGDRSKPKRAYSPQIFGSASNQRFINNNNSDLKKHFDVNLVASGARKKEGFRPSFDFTTFDFTTFDFTTFDFTTFDFTTFDFMTFDFMTFDQVVTPGGLEPPPWEPESHVLSS